MNDSDRVMANAFERVQDQVHRYFIAIYGTSYTYRAPETFSNALERWMLYATNVVDAEMADKQMMAIEVMAAGKSHLMENGQPRRLKACVEKWAECYEGGYHPSCCRFPKSCSCTVYDDNAVTADDLEQSP